MSKILLKNIKFLYEINEFYNKNKDKIIDIILFGSAIKGKENPRDIDLLILFKEKKDLDLSYELKKRLKKFKIIFWRAHKGGGSHFYRGFLVKKKKILPRLFLFLTNPL